MHADIAARAGRHLPFDEVARVAGDEVEADVELAADLRVGRTEVLLGGDARALGQQPREAGHEHGVLRGGAIGGGRHLHVGVRVRHLRAAAVEELFHHVAHVLARDVLGPAAGLLDELADGVGAL